LKVIVDSLQSHFAKPITYEDPVWLFNGDLEREDGNPKLGLELKYQRFELGALTSSKLNQELLTTIVDAYAAQFGAPAFRVSRSNYGFHIIPEVSRDESGALRKPTALLDTVINLSDHSLGANAAIKEICDAITVSTGIRVWPALRPLGTGFFRLYSGNRPVSAAWKGGTQTARSALIAVLNKSATTFYWQLLCQPHEKASGRFCVLNISPLEVTVKDRSGKDRKQFIEYDRCAGCPIGLPRPPRN